MRDLTSFTSSNAIQQIQEQADAMERVTASFDSFALRQVDNVRGLNLFWQTGIQADAIRSLDSLSYIREKIKYLYGDLTSIQRIQEQINTFQNLTASYDTSAFSKIQHHAETMKRLNTLQDIFSSQQNIYDAKSLFTTLGEIRSTYNRLNISHSEYADLIDHGEKADLNELEELVDNVETDATDEFEFFTTLIIRVEEKQESSKTKFWNIVLTLIISYIMSVWAPIHLNPWSDDVSQEIKETHTTNDFRSYRYVTAKRGLLVRVDSNQKSQIIGGLPYGSPVRFLRKSDDRNWTFIEDEDGNQGWVFSRYLKKSR